MAHQRLTRTSLACAATLMIGLGVGACSAATPSGEQAASSSGGAVISPGATSSATAVPVRTVNVTVHGSSITPAPETIPLKVGETIRIVVTSDHDDEVHAHGFEVEKEIKAGEPTTLELKGSASGVYEVEMHHPALTLLQIAVS